MVEKTRPVIIWNNRASIYFKKAYEQIKEESYTNAEKVRKELLKLSTVYPDILKNIHGTSLRKITLAATALLKSTPIGSPTSIQQKRSGFYASDM